LTETVNADPRKSLGFRGSHALTTTSQ